ncbi:hypothetical protein ACFL0Q_08045 [Thermodesulfobacteriota bacterium]
MPPRDENNGIHRLTSAKGESKIKKGAGASLFLIGTIFLSMAAGGAEAFAQVRRREAKAAPISEREGKLDSPAQDHNKPRFVPDEIIIKLKDTAQTSISITYNEKKHVVSGLSSLYKLHKKHAVYKMEPILKESKKKRKNQRITRLEERIENIGGRITKLQSNKSLSPKEQQELQDLLDNHNMSLSRKSSLIKKLDTFEKKRSNLLSLYRIKMTQGAIIEEVLSEYQKNPNVEYAEPNYIYL